MIRWTTTQHTYLKTLPENLRSPSKTRGEGDGRQELTEMSHTEDRGTIHRQVNHNAESRLSKTDTENTKGLLTKAINCVLLLVPVTEAIKTHSRLFNDLRG
jgi:hypothetical protein